MIVGWLILAALVIAIGPGAVWLFVRLAESAGRTIHMWPRVSDNPNNSAQPEISRESIIADGINGGALRVNEQPNPWGIERRIPCPTCERPTGPGNRLVPAHISLKGMMCQDCVWEMRGILVN